MEVRTGNTQGLSAYKILLKARDNCLFLFFIWMANQAFKWFEDKTQILKELENIETFFLTVTNDKVDACFTDYQKCCFRIHSAKNNIY